MADKFKFNPLSGKMDLVSDVSGYVPYIGATGSVDLGSYSVAGQTLTAKTELSLWNTSGITFYPDEGITYLGQIYCANFAEITFDAITTSSTWAFSGLTDNRRFAFPDASGTIALTTDLASYVPYIGATGNVDLGVFGLTGQTFYVKNGLYLYNASAFGFYSDEGITYIGSLYSDTTGILTYDMATLGTSVLNFSGVSGTKTFTFPDADGTVALTTISIVNKSGDYTITDLDNVITCDSSGGTITVTLPPAAGATGKIYTIKKVDSSVNTVTIDGDAAETIDGDLTKIMVTQYVSMSVISNGSNWLII